MNLHRSIDQSHPNYFLLKKMVAHLQDIVMMSISSNSFLHLQALINCSIGFWHLKKETQVCKIRKKMEENTFQRFNKYIHTVMPEPGGPGGPLAPPPIFGRSFNPIPTGEGSLSPPIATGTLNVFHLPASLYNL